MSTVPIASERNPGSARTLAYYGLALGIVAAVLTLTLSGGSVSGAAHAIHEQARHIASVEAAHEAALETVKATEAFVRRHRRWPQSMAETGHKPVLPAQVAAIELPATTGQIVAVRFLPPYAAYSLHYVRMADADKEEGDWNCDAAGIPDTAVPPDCQTTAVQGDALAAGNAIMDGK